MTAGMERCVANQPQLHPLTLSLIDEQNQTGDLDVEISYENAASSVSSLFSISSRTSENGHLNISATGNQEQLNNQPASQELERWVRVNGSLDDTVVDEGNLISEHRMRHGRVTGLEWATMVQEPESGLGSFRFFTGSSTSDVADAELSIRRDSPPFVSLAPIEASHSFGQATHSVHLSGHFQSDSYQITGRVHYADDLNTTNQKCSSDDMTQRTPTKSFYEANPAHPVFPVLVRNMTLEDSSGPAYSGFEESRSNRFITSYSQPMHANHTPSRRSQDIDTTTLSPNSPLSALELTGDVRTVNMHALDQLPLRTWL
ncbi:hypothetical protein CRM22_003378 [Opisthorchis felineus]|uniref:Uncharacterized protein n=1 Tax=Opisthorchis felineus TaxID=147828 RepID=A0A4S2M1J0_OPIFE|nr:hypothetical protein CRM22_003378 [Opisthorchis felineus]